MRRFVLTALLRCASPAPKQDADAPLARCLQERDGDIKACVTDMPQMRADQPDADFRAATEALASLRRLVVALNASGSRAAALGGETRMAATGQAVDALLDDLPRDVTASLVAPR